jgi:predicted RNA-binding protein with TRAM domain
VIFVGDVGSGARVRVRVRVREFGNSGNGKKENGKS